MLALQSNLDFLRYQSEVFHSDMQATHQTLTTLSGQSQHAKRLLTIVEEFLHGRSTHVQDLASSSEVVLNESWWTAPFGEQADHWMQTVWPDLALGPVP